MNKYDALFMLEAIMVGTMSHCIKRSIGCVLVKDNRIIAHGYNGTEPGEDNCCEDWSEEQQKYISRPGVKHAEKNVKEDCEERGIDVTGCTLYVTYEPCGNCADDWKDTGISRVVYIKDNKNHAGSDKLRKKDIIVDKFTDIAAICRIISKIDLSMFVLFNDNINYHSDVDPEMLNNRFRQEYLNEWIPDDNDDNEKTHTLSGIDEEEDDESFDRGPNDNED